MPSPPGPVRITGERSQQWDPRHLGLATSNASSAPSGLASPIIQSRPGDGNVVPSSGTGLDHGARVRDLGPACGRGTGARAHAGRASEGTARQGSPTVRGSARPDTNRARALCWASVAAFHPAEISPRNAAARSRGPSRSSSGRRPSSPRCSRSGRSRTSSFVRPPSSKSVRRSVNCRHSPRRSPATSVTPACASACAAIIRMVHDMKNLHSRQRRNRGPCQSQAWGGAERLAMGRAVPRRSRPAVLRWSQLHLMPLTPSRRR